ncbi:hypothetical protein [Flavobacterium suzhouense]|uniref:Uncharacterized protein n=1 Tax=Flavobacterium suzhouense TaxID=1529638 RepID=A0ABW5NP84_9FLAO
MRKGVFIAICCFISLMLHAQDGGYWPSTGVRRAGWHELGAVYAIHTSDHNTIKLKRKDANFKKLKVVVRNYPLTITEMRVFYDSGEMEILDCPLPISKNGESKTLEIPIGKRNISSISFWYDSKEFKRGKAEVTVFAMR